MSRPELFLLFLVLMGALAAVLRLLSQRAPVVPYQVVLAAGGIVLGLVPGLPLPPVRPDLILLAFVPGLVFEAALGLDLEDLRRMAAPVALLATAGVVVTVLLVGAGVHLALGFGWAASFLLGAIVAPTDPIAVVSLLRRISAPGRLAALLEGESLFNDGTGVAVFTAVLATIATGSPSLADFGLRFVVVSGGGIAAGLLIGIAGTLLLRTADEPELEILVTLVVAYGSYLAGQLLGFSGVVAVVSAGIVVARSGRLRGTQLQGFWRLLAFVLNAVLFVLVGEALPTHAVVALAVPVLVAYLVMLVARLPAVYGLLAPFPMPWGWRHLAYWGGVRGALSVALALAATGARGVDARVSTVAYGMVVLSLLVQGGLMPPIARRLLPGGPAPGSRSDRR